MKSFRLILTTTLLCGIIASCKDKTDVTPDDGAAVAANPDWTTESHSNDVDPNYDIVFPQNQVNTLEITMTATDWNSIKTDMQTKSGTAFGAGRGMGPGTAPGGNGAGGLDLIPGDPFYVAITMKFNGKTGNKAGFRLKGNSSLSSTWRSGVYKLPFRLKMDEYEDTYPEIKNQRLYGFKVKVTYRGTLIDGTEFDKGEGVEFAVGGVIPGWTEAVQLMKPGAKFKLFVPSNLAYGEHGMPPQIGPNATLVFDVELLEVKAGEAAAKPDMK